MDENFIGKKLKLLAWCPPSVGRLRPQKSDDPNLEAEPWGMMIYKKAGVQ
jgi:hypothetical protein